MVLDIFFRGLVVGLLASIPLGPVGVLCIQRTVSKKRLSGFISGTGAALADTIFASVAFFSLSLVQSFIEQNMTILKIVGGVCVIVMGFNILLSNPVVQIRRNRAGKSNLWQDFISVFLVTLANPAMILIFVALFAAFGISSETLTMPTSMLMIGGVLCGACSWWFLLTLAVNLIRRNFRPRHMLWMNRVSGTVIVVLGAVAILSIFISAVPKVF